MTTDPDLRSSGPVTRGCASPVLSPLSLLSYFDPFGGCDGSMSGELEEVDEELHRQARTCTCLLDVSLRPGPGRSHQVDDLA